MKIKTRLIMLLVLLLNPPAFAGIINNGDFQSCNFDNWQKDTDGAGDLGSTGDFSINNNAGECSAQISVDLLDDVEVFDANTLFTALDLSVTSGTLQLSFDWAFESFDLDDLLSDFFFVSLNDGAGNLFGADGNNGFLKTPVSTAGTGSFSVILDPSFYNQNNWFLDFTLQAGFNDESYSSKLNIDNVALTTIATEVPEPSSMAILLLAMLGLFAQKYGKSNKEHSNEVL